MINQKEKLEILEKFFWRLNFHRTISQNEPAVMKMLKMVDEWVEAHSDKNGERTDAEIKKNVQAAYEKLKTLP